MNREIRYYVFKFKDVDAFFDVNEKRLLERLSVAMHSRRVSLTPRPEFLVLESDWPEYDVAWKSIEERMDRSEKIDSIAKDLYGEWTANQPIHCNRFPAWHELAESEKKHWLDRVNNSAPKEEVPKPFRGQTNESFLRGLMKFYGITLGDTFGLIVAQNDHVDRLLQKVKDLRPAHNPYENEFPVPLRAG